jgi:hypothetical protein
MSTPLKSDYDAAQELRAAQLKYAAASIARRYEYAQQVTGMSTAERVASLTTQRLTAQCPPKK